jgi:hypothetical protein
MANSYAYVKASVARRVEWMQSLKRRPCERCGTEGEPERMHWHHRDPATKTFGLSSGAFRVGRERLLAEIAKCELLCEACHQREHGNPGGHGTARSYSKGCRCDECREAARVKAAKRRERLRAAATP